MKLLEELQATRKEHQRVACQKQTPTHVYGMYKLFITLSYLTIRTVLPTAAKVARVFEQEGWTTNCLKPDEIAKLWRPSSKQRIETDPIIQRCVAEQTWTGFAIKDFGPPKGFGKKTF